MTVPPPIGVIHGRFQVLHNDHLKYLLAGKALCDHLIVGITNPDPEMTAPEPTAPCRSDLRNNPLTYHERAWMVRAALMEAGIDPATFSTAPLPISRPELLANYAPVNAIYFLTIYDDWGRAKKARLEGLGLTTRVMWERSEAQKGISATEVRRAIREGGPWRSLVPSSVAALADAWGLQDRLGGSSRSGS
jgi:nicotinamide-nucleotide adenylyltransferase